MIDWFISLDGVLTISILALLSLLARTFMDFRYVFPEDMANLDTRATGWVIFFYSLIFGGWIWALLGSAGGSNPAMIVNLVFNALTGLGGGLASYIFFRPFCRAARPVADISIAANLILGLLASVATAIFLI
jgi:hypothetical protein